MLRAFYCFSLTGNPLSEGISWESPASGYLVENIRKFPRAILGPNGDGRTSVLPQGHPKATGNQSYSPVAMRSCFQDDSTRGCKRAGRPGNPDFGGGGRYGCSAFSRPEAGHGWEPTTGGGGIFLLTGKPSTASICGSGRIAQLGEHRPYKPGVTGSNPVPPTKKSV